MNDLTDPAVVEQLSGNAVLNGVPVTVAPRGRWRPMTPDAVRGLALDLPDVVELPHHGFPSFRAGPKQRIFATMPTDEHPAGDARARVDPGGGRAVAVVP